MNCKHQIGLPRAEDIRRAVEQYLAEAYPRGVPAGVVEKYMPPRGFDPAGWLIGEVSERTPPEVNLDQVRSFALRIGNEDYLHMKLRLTRPPSHGVFLLTVDSHDAFLEAPPGTPDHEALEKLKRKNAAVAAAVAKAWDQAGLPTERNYLRQNIYQARHRKSQRSSTQ